MNTRGQAQGSGASAAGVVEEVQRADRDDVASGQQLESVLSRLREHDLLKRQDEPRLRWCSGGSSVDLGLPLDGENATTPRTDQVGTQRLRPGFVRSPFDDEDGRHVLLDGGETGWVQLVEHAAEIAAAVSALARVLAERGCRDFRGGAIMLGRSGGVKPSRHAVCREQG